MNEKIKRIYRQLLADAASCWKVEGTELEKIEQCFRLAIRHWYKLRDEYINYTFESKEEEIDFFRNLKPLFTGRIEFYTYAYKAVLFQPDDIPRLQSFWKEELKKQAVFKKENEDFIKYFKSGDTSLDKKYFLKRNDAPDDSRRIGVEIKSECDHLVAAIHAHELYHKYAQDKLKKLKDL